MEKVLGILNIILRVLVIVVMAATAVLSISMGYIMFAPDDLPKPFKLVYQYPEESPKYLPPGVLPPSGCVPVVNAETINEEGSAGEAKPAQGVLVDMSTKIINLSDPAGRKYIRLTVVLELEPPPAPTEEPAKGEHGEEVDPNAEFTALVEARMPQMDDIVITLLSTKTYEQLYTAEGKENLRQEIATGINERVTDLTVRSVYFTEFVVQ